MFYLNTFSSLDCCNTLSSFQASFCFSEHHLFLLASALLAGITTGINYNFFSENYVAFPIIYKEKSSQIKEKLVPILQNSVLKGLRVSKMFYPMYIATCLLLRSNSTSLIMDCFNLHLFCMLLIITTLLFTVNSTMLTVFGIAACEPLDLNLEEVRIKSFENSPWDQFCSRQLLDWIRKGRHSSSVYCLFSNWLISQANYTFYLS